jgi:membrane-associated phospholipid phosphatase
MKFFLNWLVFICILLFSQYSYAQYQPLTQAGNIGQIALPLSGLAATLFYRDKTGAVELVESFASALAITYVLKPIVNRQRPNGGKYSFPSGHTTSAFAGAAFLQMRYGWKWGIPAYLAASLVGYSRVNARAHWTTDVLAGAAIGIGTNLIFTHPYKNVTICPYVGEHKTFGLTAITTW